MLTELLGPSHSKLKSTNSYFFHPSVRIHNVHVDGGPLAYLWSYGSLIYFCRPKRKIKNNPKRILRLKKRRDTQGKPVW